MLPSSTVQHYPLTETLAWIARGLVMALLLIAPWPYAMAEWKSQLWLVPVVGAIFLLASLVAFSRRLSIGNPMVWSLSAVLAVGLLQVTPLPEPLWKMLAPAAQFEQNVAQLASDFATAEETPTEAETTPLVDSQAVAAPTNEIPIARTLSIDPLQTRATLCVFAMGVAMFVSSIILFRDRQSVALLLGSLALSGVAISLLGIFQAVVAGDWTLLEVPKSSSFATFYSRNSAPQFLACCFAATGGLLAMYRANAKRRQKDKRYELVYPAVNPLARLRRLAEDFVGDVDPIAFILLVIMLLQSASVLIANSRGGILAFVASGLAIVLVYAMGKEASFSALITVPILVIGSGLFLSMYGLDELVGARLDTISKEAYQLDNVRLTLWSMAFSQPSLWLLGSGLGTFHFALLPLYATPQTTWFYHAENIYVELASGAGLITLLIALGGLIWLIWQLLSRPASSSTAGATRFACLFAVLAVGLHNLVDFSLILPAIFLPMACLVGAYLGARHQVRQRGRRSRRSGSPTKETASTKREPTQQWETPRGNVSGGSPAPTSSQRPTDNADSTWRPKSLVVCLVLVATAVGLGYRPLSAFAFAEQMRVSEQPDSDLVESIRNAMRSPLATFAEPRLQIGRWRQELASQQLFESPRWPNDVNPTMRRSLSHPEFFNTALHAIQDPELSLLKEFLIQEPAVLENLAASQDDMLAALAACPLDWRASWGVLRSDIGKMSAHDRRRNYARILLTCRNNQQVLQASGTHALMIGDWAAGTEIWRQLLPVSQRARTQVVRLVDRFLTAEQLVTILPDDPMQRIEIARLASLGGDSKTTDAILEAIDLQEALSAARYAADWPQIAWCAEQKGDIDREIDAWEQAVISDAYNPHWLYLLVLALQRDQRLPEAMHRIDDGLDRFADNAQYQPLFEKLKADLAP